MFYNDIIKKLMQDKKNPVNSMYLHEINLKWSIFEKLTEDITTLKNVEIVNAINNFVSAIRNKKYQYNSSTKNGFKPDSLLFSEVYLHDLISVLVERNKIINNQGISWGLQSFSTNLKFNPQNLGVMDKDLRFEQEISEKLLCLTQKLDFQFRIKGKRNFHKYEIIFPLIIFFTFKNLDETDFIKSNHIAQKAKATFERSKSIIITETINQEFIPDVGSSSVDALYILRRQSSNKVLNPISTEVVDMLDNKITDFLTENEWIGTEFIKKGFLLQ